MPMTADLPYFFNFISRSFAIPRAVRPWTLSPPTGSRGILRSRPRAVLAATRDQPADARAITRGRARGHAGGAERQRAELVRAGIIDDHHRRVARNRHRL